MSTLMARYPGINPMNSEEATGVYVENDPASLASQAAVELDNLLRSRGTSVPAVLILSRLINDEFSGGASKATTVGVMKRAISHAKLAPEPLNRVEQVESEASQVADHLKEIYEKVQGKEQLDFKKIEQMRTFCVAYSIQRSATQPLRNRNPKNPYRR